MYRCLNKKIYRFVGDSIWEKYLSSNNPNIFDVIFPDEGVQEEFLSSYGNYEGSLDDIPTDLLASIPLVGKNSK